MSQTVLTLSPEFGGARFGPFGVGTITLGTDASRCQVALHPSTRALPVHALLTDTGQAWQIQPAQVGAVVFVRSGGRVTQVQGASPLQPGDTVVLGHQNGPGLVVSRMQAAPQAAARSGGPRIPGSQNLTANKFSREIWRQVESTLVTMPYGRDIYRFVSRARTGALLRPRNVIAMVVGLVGFMGFGCLSCFGAIGAMLALR